MGVSLLLRACNGIAKAGSGRHQCRTENRGHRQHDSWDQVVRYESITS